MTVRTDPSVVRSSVMTVGRRTGTGTGIGRTGTGIGRAVVSGVRSTGNVTGMIGVPRTGTGKVAVVVTVGRRPVRVRTEAASGAPSRATATTADPVATQTATATRRVIGVRMPGGTVTSAATAAIGVRRTVSAGRAVMPVTRLEVVSPGIATATVPRTGVAARVTEQTAGPFLGDGTTGVPPTATATAVEATAPSAGTGATGVRSLTTTVSGAFRRLTACRSRRT